MKFKDEAQRKKFIKDEKYYDNLDSYCLGNSLKEAGEVMRKIIKDREKKEKELKKT